ncbi:conserved Plasmodium protein, unknown function [Plasmodium gallinaceum]|uniref:Uncharacterized protein n=1 Tax=Plasmodium gallinaceum TaxID=5849 RepID=A0A1J1GZD7_PLAGA|nr:conserved Plasmodium protein, unknown function [Plasmodium gallinaceum]CRG97593.1 conserved Plasmodium protein, unknown function [Plasmodium gallinaceum]
MTKTKKNYTNYNYKKEDNSSKDFTFQNMKYENLEDVLNKINENCTEIYKKNVEQSIGSNILSLQNSCNEHPSNLSSSNEFNFSNYSSYLSESSDNTYGEIDNLCLSDLLSINEDCINNSRNSSENNINNFSINESINLSNLSDDSSITFSIDKRNQLKNKEKNIYDHCISIFSLNTYLYNDIYRYNPHLYGIYEKCRNNENRCKNIALLCSQFDLIFLRSIYGKYQKILYDKLKYTHTILLDNVPSSINFLNDIFYTFQNYFNGNGGLFICWTKKLFRLSYYDFMFLSSDILLKRKVIKIIKLIYKENYNLYFLHCEFDLYSIQNKLSNLNDLITLIKKILWNIYIFHLFYKNKKYLKKKEEKSNENDIFYEGINKSEAIKKINNKRKENYSNSENSSIKNNKINDNTINDCDKNISIMTFKNSSMFVIGSFNIDLNENKELYEKLTTLNNHGKMKDMFFYKNINYKLQKTYNIVERKNTLISGLNYCFGLTDNIFLVESFFLKKEDIDELIYLYNPIDILNEKLKTLNKSVSNYNLENIIKLINKNGILIKFQDVFNYGVDILTQKKNKEFSDHWILSARFHMKNYSKNMNLNIEKQLHNFLRNVDKFFILNKNYYDQLCEVNSILKNKKIEYKNEDLKVEKYNYFKKCVISSENIHCINKIEKKLHDTLLKCFELN